MKIYELMPFLIPFITAVIFFPWFYFLIHAVQYIENPIKRSYWVILFVTFNILIIPFYFIFEFYPACKKRKYKIFLR